MADGNQLRALRKAKGLSQVELADLCGLSQAQISQLERSLVRLSIETARQIAAALEVPLVALLSPADWVVKQRDPSAHAAEAGSNLQSGTRLREFRLAAGLSMQSLADKAGCSKMKVSVFERGQIGSGIPFLRRCATILGVSLADLLCDPGEITLPPDERLLVSLFRSLSKPRQADAITLIRAIQDEGRDDPT